MCYNSIQIELFKVLQCLNQIEVNRGIPPCVFSRIKLISSLVKLWQVIFLSVNYQGTISRCSLIPSMKSIHCLSRTGHNSHPNISDGLMFSCLKCPLLYGLLSLWRCGASPCCVSIRRWYLENLVTSQVDRVLWDTETIWEIRIGFHFILPSRPK